MSKPYDATSRDLLELGPADWVTFFGAPRQADQVRLVDAELSTVTAEADKVILVEDPLPWILHLEFQTSSERYLPRRLQRYNAMLQERHQKAVATAVVLLRPEAEASTLTGEWIVQTPIVPDWSFQYRILRVWELDATNLLQSGLSLLSLAPISNIEEADLPSLIDRIKVQLGQSAEPPLQGRLWTAIQILLGLRYEAAFIDQLLTGVIAMEDSATYQAIIRKGQEQGLRIGRQEGREEGREEGRIVEAIQAILRVGQRRLRTSPPLEVVNYLETITELNRLEALLEQAVEMQNWTELLSKE